MPDTPFLDRAIKVAFRRLKAAAENPRSLDEPTQTILAVYGAQGVIDNGGFRFFFESNWPAQPPYTFFSDAYRRIGAERAANAIDRAVAMFPFARPHLAKNRRNQFMSPLPDTAKFFRLDRVCGDATVWVKLEEYVREHSRSFWKRPNKWMQLTRSAHGQAGRGPRS
jgi:Domain of unknown function (DUF4375)